MSSEIITPDEYKRRRAEADAAMVAREAVKVAEEKQRVEAALFRFADAFLRDMQAGVDIWKKKDSAQIVSNISAEAAEVIFRRLQIAGWKVRTEKYRESSEEHRQREADLTPYTFDVYVDRP